MPNDLPQKIWQDQPRESIRMSPNEIRRKAQALQSRDRLRAISAMIVGVLLCVGFAVAFGRETHTIARVAYVVLAFSGLLSTIQAYRWVWPGALASGATYETCLRFYRRELERRRDFALHIWTRSGIVVAFFGVALLLGPPLAANPRMLPKAAPFLVLLAIWFAIFLPTHRRKRRRLLEEIDQLDAYERDAQ
jgi:hypothetical protein